MLRIPTLCTCLIALSAASCGKNQDKAAADKAKAESAAAAESKAAIESARVAAAEQPAPEPKTLPADTGEHGAALRLAKTYGSTDTDGARGLGIDSKGDYLVCGYFKGTGLFGAQQENTDASAYLAKFSSSDGSVVWSAALGGTGEDSAEALAVAPDDSTVIVGGFSGDVTIGDGTLKAMGADDIFIAKFAADGHRLWAKRVGGIDIDAAHAVSIDAAGNSYITGVYGGKVLFGEVELASQGDADIFLTKLSPTGEFLWSKSFGSLGQDYGRALAFDSQGNVILLAEISLQVDFGGGAVTTNGNRDIALVKLDGNGNHLWSKSVGNNFDDIAIALAVDPADNILFTGSFEDTANFGGNDIKSAGRSDMYVTKFDTAGKHVWTRRFGGKDEDWGNSIASDSFGNSYITGWFWYEMDVGGTVLKSKGKEDIFLLKLDAAGDVRWAKSFGDSNLDMGKVVAVDGKGGVVTVGAFNQQIDFGSGVMKPTAGGDPKLVKGDFYLAAFDR